MNPFNWISRFFKEDKAKKLINAVTERPNKFLYRVFKTVSGKRKKKRVLSKAGMSRRINYHFGTFSPINKHTSIIK